MAIEYGLVPNESFESLYSEICLSHNQVKQILNHYLNSIKNMTIQLNEENFNQIDKRSSGRCPTRKLKTKGNCRVNTYAYND